MSFHRSWCQSEQSKCSNQMFEVSSFRAYTVMQSITPLIHCSVNNVLIKTTPLFNQSFFQMVDVTDLAAVVDSFLQNAPNRIVHWIEIWTVQWPIQWLMKSGISADNSATISRARWAGALSCWKVKKSPETEQMPGSNCCLNSVSL